MSKMLELALWVISLECFLVESKFEMKNFVIPWDLRLAAILRMFSIRLSELLFNMSFIPICITAVSNLPSLRVGSM